jgi:hypothetical protein
MCLRRRLIGRVLSLASPEDGSAATGRWLCVPLPPSFYVGPLKNSFLRFRTPCMYIRNAVLVSTVYNVD